MAINIINNDVWASGSPTIYFNLNYEKQRVGADMQYRLIASISTVTGASYFGFPIYFNARFDGVQLISTTLKEASPSQWSSPISYTSPWVTVENKTSGSTALSVTLYSGLGNSRSETWNASLSVDGSASRLALSSSSMQMNGSTSYTATITRDSTSFTHTLRLQVGNQKVDYTGLTTTKAFTLPVAWNSQVPNSTSTTGVATLYTYASGQLVGQVSQNFTAVVPTNIVPTFTSITATRVDGVVPSAWGVYVQSKSKVTLQINGATGVYGSTIKGYSITGTGVSSTSSRVTSSFLTTSGTLTYTAKITDSRGRTATKTVSIVVQAYKVPTLGALAYRANSSGSIQPTTGTSAYIKANSAFSSVSNNNTATLTAKYKLSSATSYSSALTLSNNVVKIAWIELLSISESYDVLFTVTDLLGARIEKIITIPSAQRLANFDSENNSVAIGGFAEKSDTFSVLMDNFEFKGEEVVTGEKGTWIPTVKQGSFQLGTVTKAIYERVGGLCHIMLVAEARATSTTNTTTIEIGGLPFNTEYHDQMGLANTPPVGDTVREIFATASSNVLRLRKLSVSGAMVDVSSSDFANTEMGQIMLTGTYTIDR